MRNLPRFALVPLAVLISALPLAALVSPAGADTASDCDSAFTAAPAGGLSYATDPPERLAWTGQTVRLSAGWDPAAWDSLSSALACVEVDDVGDGGLGAADAAPENAGTFEHAFTIPEVAAGTRLCTRIRLAGDPAGDATEAVWVSRTHCFEVDHDEAPPEDTPPPENTTPPPAAQPPAGEQPPTAHPSAGEQAPTAHPSAGEQAPAPGAPAAPATSAGTAGDSPSPDTPAAGDTPAPGTPAADTAAGPEGAGGPAGTPFDSAAAPPAAAAPAPSGEVIPQLPATGYASLGLLHRGEVLLAAGLALLVLARRPRRHPVRA